MKKNIILSVFLFLILFSASRAELVTAETGTVVRIDPSTTYLMPGQSATIEVWVEDVSELWGFDLDIHFDPAKISAQSSALGNFLELGQIAKNEIDNVNGIIEFDMTQWGQEITPKSSSGVLITFEITLLESITTTNLTIVSVLLTDRNGVEIPCDIESGVVMMSEYSAFLPLVVR